MVVPCGGINEKLPVTCASVAEDALLHDGTAQSEVIRERPAHANCRVIAIQKPSDSFVVGVRGVNALQYRPIPVQQALRRHCRNETQIAFDVVSICVEDKASFAP